MVRARLRVLEILALGAFVPLVARLAWLQLDPATVEKHMELSQHERVRLTAPRRGQILARDGTVLAGNRPIFQLRFAPAEIHPRAEPLRRLGEVLEGMPGFPPLAELEAHLVALGEAARRERDGQGAASPAGDWVLLLEGLDARTARRLNGRWSECPGVLEARQAAGNSLYQVWFHLERALTLERTLKRLETLLRREDREAPGRDALAARVHEAFARIDASVAEALERPAAAPAKAKDEASPAAGLPKEEQKPLTAAELARRAEVARNRRQDHLRNSTFLLVAEVPVSVVTAVEYFREDYAGVRCVDEVRREYPLGEACGTVVGWLQRADGDGDRLKELRSSNRLISAAFLELEEAEFRERRVRSLCSTDAIGASGLEQWYDEKLRGLYGRRRVSINRKGEALALLEDVEPEHGRDLPTTIDARLQKALYQELEKQIEPKAPPGSGAAGSAAVMDLETGGLLACVGFPGVDGGRLRDKAYHEELEARWKPRVMSWLVDRPSSITLFPGSVFKLVVAAAALEGLDPWDAPRSPDERFHCGGAFGFIPGLDCDATHGPVDLVESLQVSCNVYYYSLAHGRLSPVTIDTWARRLGYGVPTGIDLPTNRGAVGVLPCTSLAGLPGPEILRGGGAACHFAIGQNPVKATPLQVLRSVAAIALGTGVPRPHLVTPSAPEPLPLRNPRTLPAIREGLWRVGHTSRGTAWEKSELNQYNAAFKTGTAELVKEPVALHNGWLVGYAPYDKPRIAFVAVIERTTLHGSEAAGPVVRCILEHFAQQDPAAYRLANGGSP